MTSPRFGGPAPCGLSRDVDLPENELGQEHPSKDRHRNTQKGADQKVFREAFGLEFRVERDGFCSEDQADRRGGLNDQRGDHQKSLQPYDLQSGVFAVARWIFPETAFYACCQSTDQRADQITTAKDYRHIDHRHG